jgi:hypothetical protein
VSALWAYVIALVVTVSVGTWLVDRWLGAWDADRRAEVRAAGDFGPADRPAAH